MWIVPVWWCKYITELAVFDVFLHFYILQNTNCENIDPTANDKSGRVCTCKEYYIGDDPGILNSIISVSLSEHID